VARAILDILSDAGLLLRENPFHRIAYDGFDLTLEEWENALGDGPKRKVFALTDTYTEERVGEPDFTMDMRLRFKGNFIEKDGDWSGKLKSVQIFKDGDLVGTIKTKGKIDLGDIFGGTDSGALWEALSLDGYKVRLTNDDDRFVASNGNDVVRGLGGDDWISTYDGNDRIFGGNGNDTLQGFNDEDRIFGGRGNDDMDGGSGDDMLVGNAGADRFREVSDFSSDTWRGGGGNDIFEIGNFRDGDFGATVLDFRKKKDKVDLTADDTFFFVDFEGIRYIGDAEFSEDPDVYEVRMENGVVEVDSNGDGEVDKGIFLKGHDSFQTSDTSWLIAPADVDFL